jgi:hypothetical protein
VLDQVAGALLVDPHVAALLAAGAGVEFALRQLGIHVPLGADVRAGADQGDLVQVMPPFLLKGLARLQKKRASCGGPFRAALLPDQVPEAGSAPRMIAVAR